MLSIKLSEAEIALIELIPEIFPAHINGCLKLDAQNVPGVIDTLYDTCVEWGVKARQSTDPQKTWGKTNTLWQMQKRIRVQRLAKSIKAMRENYKTIQSQPH